LHHGGLKRSIVDAYFRVFHVHLCFLVKSRNLKLLDFRVKFEVVQHLGELPQTKALRLLDPLLNRQEVRLVNVLFRVKFEDTPKVGLLKFSVCFFN
jgi:hypothetical protein